MNRIILLVILCFTMTGCSTLGAASAFFGKKPSIEVNANVGKNVKQDKSQIKIETGKTEQTADTISNDVSYKAQTINQITQNIPPYIIGLLILAFGWVIPDPVRCYKTIKFLIYDITNSFFVAPGKSILRFFRREK